MPKCDFNNVAFQHAAWRCSSGNLPHIYRTPLYKNTSWGLLLNLIVSLLDINECNIPQFRDTCHPNATCVNEVGRFSCVCNAGFYGDGQDCSDIDECQQTNNCSNFATCANTIGSYVCTCLDGFSGDGFTCLGMIFS